jgi:hypothetical protein
MTFSFIGDIHGFDYSEKGANGILRVYRMSRIALIYGILGAAITLGIMFILGFFIFIAMGNITYAIGTGALSYTLLYGSYALVKKKQALEKYSPYIFH